MKWSLFRETKQVSETSSNNYALFSTIESHLLSYPMAQFDYMEYCIAGNSGGKLYLVD